MPALHDTEQAPHSDHPDQTQLELEEAQVTFTCRQIMIMMISKNHDDDVDAHPTLPRALPWLDCVQVAPMPVASTEDHHHNLSSFQSILNGSCLVRYAAFPIHQPKPPAFQNMNLQ